MQATRTLKAFDDVVTAPIHGFQSADHYDTVCSCRQYLAGVRIPTLIFQAMDDPFQSAGGIPAERELAEAVTLEKPAHGGHVGFLGTADPSPIASLPARRLQRGNAPANSDRRPTR